MLKEIVEKIVEADGSMDDLGVIPDGSQINGKLTRSGFMQKGKFAGKSILVDVVKETLKEKEESDNER